MENIFYLSFLIRDGKVAWEVEDSEPVICKSFSMSTSSLLNHFRPLRYSYWWGLCTWRDQATTHHRIWRGTLGGMFHLLDQNICLLNLMQFRMQSRHLISRNQWSPNGRKTKVRRVLIRSGMAEAHGFLTFNREVHVPSPFQTQAHGRLSSLASRSVM